MRVLVTGHRGYVGSVLTCVLRHARFEVVGLDCDWYRGCDFGRVAESVPQFDTDLREVEFADLLSFDAIIHLAALPGAFGDGGSRRAAFEPPLIQGINEQATMRLAHCAKKANVSRFLFASSCAVYGPHGGAPLDETSQTRPLTPQARSKLRCEHALTKLADSSFTPVFLRIGEVYGVSPRLRLDLLVNDLVGSAVTHGRVTMHAGAAGWRSLVHVEDLCRTFAAALTAPQSDVHKQTFNVVAPNERYRVVDIADAITEMLPLCTRSAVVGLHDPHSRCVDGSKLYRTFPDLRHRWTLAMGIRQLCRAMLGAGMGPGDWRSDRYRRAPRLHAIMERGEVDRSLRKPEHIPVLRAS
ncbi:MAG: SDR family oxidoreductase [Planctomycetes bacterium]|nr:SDR family oxidoreductase [Planctomycetota bacterium]